MKHHKKYLEGSDDPLNEEEIDVEVENIEAVIYPLREQVNPISNCTTIIRFTLSQLQGILDTRMTELSID